MILIFTIFWLLIAAFALFKKKKKCVFGFCVLIIIAALMAFNTYNPDYQTFETIYNNINVSSGLDHGNDFLYLLTNRIGNGFGMSFKEFRCIYINLCLLSYFCFIRKHSKYVSLCLLFYFFTSGIFDYVQLRQFGAMAISIWIIDAAINKQQKYCLLKVFILLILAVGFHKSALFYLIFLPFFLVKKKFFKYVFGIEFLGLLGVVVLSLNNSLVYNLMRIFAGDGTASFYLISRHYVDSVPKVLFDILVQQVLLVVILMFRFKRSIGTEEKSALATVAASDVLIATLMPLNILSIQFKRLARVSLSPSYSVAFSNKTNRAKGTFYLDDIIVFALLVVYVCLYLRITLLANPSLISDLFEFSKINLFI